MKFKSLILLIVSLFILLSCDSGVKLNNPNDPNNRISQGMGELGKECYPNKTCNKGLVCDEGSSTCIKEGDPSNDDKYESDTAPFPDSDTIQYPDPDNEPEGCADDNLGKQCQTDEECGKCMICVTGGKCAKGCTKDEDCTMTGTKCNTKLARCLSIYASGKACSEAICPTGCCYAEKGLTGLKCATGARVTAATCGLCPQNQIYSPEDSKCVNAVCSTTTDDCPSINSESVNPPAKCYACKSGEYVCKAKTSTSGCSAGSIINLQECVPSGRLCIEGISSCCSGTPCIEGYCY